MKKSSTAAVQSTRNFDQKLTIGLDLGDRSSWYCVLDETGAVVGAQISDFLRRVTAPGFTDVCDKAHFPLAVRALGFLLFAAAVNYALDAMAHASIGIAYFTTLKAASLPSSLAPPTRCLTSWPHGTGR